MDTLELDGVRLAYWDEGRGQPVVFVHGVGTSGELWARDLAPLAQDCRLIVYDGHHVGLDAADELIGILREAETATAA